MRQLIGMTALAMAALTGCATGGGDPAAVATRECGFLARKDGARLVGVDGVDAMGGGDTHKVRMKLEDAMSRRASAECLYSSADKQARWASPLPAGFVKL